VEHLARELPGTPQIGTQIHQDHLEIQVPRKDEAPDRLYCRLCDRAAQGGHLGRQIEDLVRDAGDLRPVALRSSDFPKNPRSTIVHQLGQMVAEGGRRVVIGDSDWRVMAAMEGFAREQGAEPGFAIWLRQECPLSRSPALRHLLDLDLLRIGPDEAEATPEVTPLEPDATGPETSHGRTLSSEPSQDAPAGLLRLGSSRDFAAHPITLSPAHLLRHAALLGGSGSGKTTLALTLIEQMLLLGIPAILIDRKGDLVSYADSTAWQADLGDPARQAARERLRATIEIALYTPGAEQGRPLGISIAPADLGSLPINERTKLANLAAAALAGVMGYKAQGSDKQRIAILGQAIAVSSEMSGREVTLDALIDFIGGGDPALLNAIGRLDPKNFKKLTEDLETLRLMNGELFACSGERLDSADLLAATRGKTRLTIISTAFLGDTANTLFWTAQLLLDLSRYCAKHPASHPQALFMLDEADLYLPALAKPPTKEPLEGLLKRARSAGLCLLLATQSPGDLDYKSRDQITTWLLGKIKEPTALAKLKPMLAEANLDLGGRLAGQQIGEFFLVQEGEVRSLKADPSLVSPRQIPAERILALAAATRGRG
jgi:hypothetical protein